MSEQRDAGPRDGGVSIGGGLHIDKRSVGAGRDIVSQLVNTGNDNQFFIGDYQRLADAYIDPTEVFDRVDVDRFVGRAWLIADLDDFIREQDRGYFVIEAPAGLGKSALLAHLIKTRGWVHHFSSLSPGEAGIVRARLSLAAQVIRTFELVDEQTGRTPVLAEAVASRPDFLRSLLSRAADKRAHGERIVIAVDALDEAAARPGENVLGLPRLLPAGVFAVVTKRPVPVILSTEGPRRVARIDPDSPEHRDDMRTFLEREARDSLASRLQHAGVRADEFVGALLSKSGAIWVYAHYAIEQLAAEADGGLDLEALPEGLWRWYYDFWQRWKQAHQDGWHRAHLPLLATLAAAQEALTIEQLCQFAGLDPALAELPEAWRPYLTIQRGESRAYRPYHASLSDFLHGEMDRDESAEQDFADELVEATRAAHGRIADPYLSAWGGLEEHLPGLTDPALRALDGGYGLDHLCAHLRDARRLDELFALVDDPAWRTAHLLKDVSGASHLNAVMLAWDAATAVDRAAIAAGRRPPLVLREVLGALTASELHAASAALEPELLVGLLTTGAWTPDQVRAGAAAISDLDDRVEATIALAAELDGDDRTGVLADALAAAKATADLDERITQTLNLVPLLEGELRARALADALAAASAFKGPDDRADGYLAVIPHLDGDARTSALTDAVAAARAIDTTYWRLGHVIEELAPLLPSTLLPHALEIAIGIDDLERRASALAELVAFLPDPLLDDAVSAATDISDPHDRFWLLRAVLRRLAGERYAAASSATRDALLPTALDIALAIDKLGELAPFLPDSWLGDAVTAAATDLPDPRDRIQDLLVLLPRLSGEERARAHAASIDALAQITRPKARAWALRVLLEHAPDALGASGPDDALAAAQEIKGARKRLDAIIALAPHVGAERESTALGYGLVAAREMKNPERRAERIVALARSLGEPAARHEAWSAALTSALGCASPLEPLTELAADLPDALLPAAVAAVPGLRENARENALRSLAPRLGEVLLQQALAVALEVADEDSRTRSIVALAPHCPPALAGDALTSALALHDGQCRAVALAALIPRLEGEERAAAVVGARDTANTIGRAAALAADVPDVDDDRAAAHVATFEGVRAALEMIPDLRERRKREHALVSRLEQDASCAALIEVLASGRETFVGERVRATLALAEHLPVAERRAAYVGALTLARTVEPIGRARALTALAPHLRGAEREAAITAALAAMMAVDDWTYQSGTILALVALLNQAGRSDAVPAIVAAALRDAVNINNAGDRAEAITDLARHLDDGARAMAINTAFQDGPSVYDVTALAEHLDDDTPSTTIAVALEVVASIDGATDRIGAIAALAPHFDDDQRATALPRALADLATIGDAESRVSSTVALAPHLAHGERAAAVAAALAVALAVEDPMARARALIALRPELDGHELMAALDAAVSSLNAFPKGYWFQRSQTLIELVPNLPAGRREDAIEEAVGLGMLRELAPHLDDDELHQRALEAGDKLADRDDWVRVLATLAPRLSQRLLLDALAVARGVEDPSERAESIIALLPHLAHDRRTGAVSDALAAATSVDDPFYRAHRLGELTALVARDERAAVLATAIGASALKAAAEISDASDASGVFTALAERLVGEQAAVAASQAIELGCPLSSKTCEKTIGRVAEHLSLELLAKAFAAAMSMRVPARRVSALSALAPHARDLEPALLHEQIDAVLRASTREYLVAASSIRALMPMIDALLSAPSGPS